MSECLERAKFFFLSCSKDDGGCEVNPGPHS